MTNIYSKYGNQIRLHTIEVEVSNTSGMYKLPDDSILRSKTIVALSVVAPQYDQVGAAYVVQNSPYTDRPLQGNDCFYNAFLTLKEGAVTLLDAAPLATYAINPADKEVTQIFSSVFSPDKSFIQVSAPTTVSRVNTSGSFLLHFYYLGDSQ